MQVILPAFICIVTYVKMKKNKKKADREKLADTLSTVIRFLTKTEKSPDAFKRKYVREAFQGLGTLLFPRDSEKGAHSAWALLSSSRINDSHNIPPV